MHDLASSIELQMSLLLFVSLAGYLLASRIGQPAVVGIILVGLAIGPSWLGLVTYTDFVKSIAHLGAIVLLFVVGLEFNIKDLANPRYALIGALGVAVPLIAGYLTARWFAYAGPAALFIAVALTATSIAITADTLREMGRLQDAAAKAIIGAAVVDDVLALMALSVARQATSGSLDWARLGLTLAEAFGFLLVGAVAGYKLLSPLLTRVDRAAIAKRYPEMIFIFAMMIAFFYALAAELMGLSAIVGSFVAGAALEGTKLENSRDFKEGAEYLRIIFAAVFFVSLGVLTDAHALTWPVVGFVLILSLVGIVTKLIGCGLPARWVGLSGRDALLVGVGMAPRGEVAMIVALIGLNQGLIDQPVYAALVFMALITTVIPPVVIRNWL